MGAVTFIWRVQVRRMFDFRNFYSDSPPLLCRELLFDSDSGVQKVPAVAVYR